MAECLVMAEEFHLGYEKQKKALEEGCTKSEDDLYAIKGAVPIGQYGMWLEGNEIKRMPLKDVFLLLQNWAYIEMGNKQVQITLNIGAMDFKFRLQHHPNNQITVYDDGDVHSGYRWGYDKLFECFKKVDHSKIAEMMLQSVEEPVREQTSWEEEYPELANEVAVDIYITRKGQKEKERVSVKVSAAYAMRMLMVIGQVAEAARPTPRYYRTIATMLEMACDIEGQTTNEEGWLTYIKCLHTIQNKQFESESDWKDMYNSIPDTAKEFLKQKAVEMQLEDTGLVNIVTQNTFSTAPREHLVQIAWEHVITGIIGATGRLPGADLMFRKVLKMVRQRKIQFNQDFHECFVLSSEKGTQIAREIYMNDLGPHIFEQRELEECKQWEEKCRQWEEVKQLGMPGDQCKELDEEYKKLNEKRWQWEEEFKKIKIRGRDLEEEHRNLEEENSKLKEDDIILRRKKNRSKWEEEFSQYEQDYSQYQQKCEKLEKEHRKLNQDYKICNQDRRKWEQDCHKWEWKWKQDYYKKWEQDCSNSLDMASYQPVNNSPVQPKSEVPLVTEMSPIKPLSFPEKKRTCKKRKSTEAELKNVQKRKRMQENNVSTKKPKFVDLCSQQEIECSETTREDWLPSLQLSMNDYWALKNGDCLTDNLINAGQDLLKNGHPHVGGLQCTMKGEVLSFNIESGEFVQILNISRAYWITVSTVGCTPGVINVFDSLQNIDLPKQAEEQIASIIRTPRKNFMLCFQTVQTQVGGDDCGVFSIAFATSLCFGQDPTSMFYHQNMLREHLIGCLTNGVVTPFPGESKKPSRLRAQIEVNVFCKCRQPEDGRMVQCRMCKEWFHEDCERIPRAIWKDHTLSWYCHICRSCR